jgi:hypothetical protein
LARHEIDFIMLSEEEGSEKVKRKTGSKGKTCGRERTGDNRIQAAESTEQDAE